MLTCKRIKERLSSNFKERAVGSVYLQILMFVVIELSKLSHSSLAVIIRLQGGSLTRPRNLLNSLPVTGAIFCVHAKLQSIKGQKKNTVNQLLPSFTAYNPHFFSPQNEPQNWGAYYTR